MHSHCPQYAYPTLPKVKCCVADLYLVWILTLLRYVRYREPVLFGPAKQGQEVATALKGRFSMARSHKHRGIDMSVEYAAQYADGSMGKTAVQIFSMTMSSDA